MGRRLPRGVSIRSNKHSESLRISFTYRDIPCKETLRLDPTEANIKFAERLLARIHDAIEKQAFNYADFFPESKNCRRFGQVSTSIKFKVLLAKYLEKAKKTLSPSTAKGYQEASDAHLYPNFGEMRVVDITNQVVREWIERTPVTMKRMRNILIPFNHVMEQALVDNLIKSNPLDKIKLDKLMDKETRESDFEIDPFNEDEIEILLNASLHEQFMNYCQFGFFTGLRPSEEIALQWPDIDWLLKLANVDKAFVEGEFKTTKTKAGRRKVVLFRPALEALERQKKFTLLQNKFIFHHPIHNRPWKSDDEVREFWITTMNRSKLRYRNMYQTRHTYGSTMCSRGENLWWVASQMGHKSPDMLFRHYGKWINDTKEKTGYKTNYDWNSISFQKKA